MLLVAYDGVGRTNFTWLYADDFVITGTTKETLYQARSIIEDFLQDRGLSLSEEKTKIVHIEEGFDFLGWNVRKYGGKLDTIHFPVNSLTKKLSSVVIYIFKTHAQRERH